METKLVQCFLVLFSTLLIPNGKCFYSKNLKLNPLLDILFEAFFHIYYSKHCITSSTKKVLGSKWVKADPTSTTVVMLLFEFV
jgi:hypothetical protein